MRPRHRTRPRTTTPAVVLSLVHASASVVLETSMRPSRLAARVALPPLVRMTRPLNAVTSGVAVYAGALLVGAPWVPGRAMLLGIVAAIAFAAAGNVRNDITDIEVDRLAHPERPLVTGAVSPRAARFAAILLYAIAIESALLVSVAALALVLVALVLMEAYERGLKHEGLPGNLVIAALTTAPFVMGALCAARMGPDGAWSAWPSAALAPRAALWALCLLAALATAGREVLKDVEDVEADRARGARRTLPMRVGRVGAGIFAAVFLVVAALLSPLPWRLEKVLAWPYLPAVAVADACFLAGATVGVKRPDWGQRLAKLGMLAALVALLVGRAGADIA